MAASPSDPDRGCVATVAAVLGELFPLFSICSRALAATAPLLGKFPFCESGFNTSHAETEGGGGGEKVEEEVDDDLDVAFSMLDSCVHRSD